MYKYSVVVELPLSIKISWSVFDLSMPRLNFASFSS